MCFAYLQQHRQHLQTHAEVEEGLLSVHDGTSFIDRRAVCCNCHGMVAAQVHRLGTTPARAPAYAAAGICAAAPNCWHRPSPSLAAAQPWRHALQHQLLLHHHRPLSRVQLHCLGASPCAFIVRCFRHGHSPAAPGAACIAGFFTASASRSAPAPLLPAALSSCSASASLSCASSVSPPSPCSNAPDRKETR